MLSNRTIGIVGGGGYLGSDLALALAANNRVRVIDLTPPDWISRSENLSFVHCDVKRFPECERALSGVEIVFHKAGLQGNLPSMASPGTYYEVNVLGTLNVLRASLAVGVDRLIFDSTEFVYGNEVTSPVFEESPAKPCSIYGATKLICEAAVEMYDRVHGLPSMILRFCRVRDPEKRDVITIVTERVLSGQAVSLVEAGAAAMDFVDRHDVTRASIAAAESNTRGQVINIGPGEAITLSEIVHAVSAASQRPVEIAYENNPAIATAEYQFGPKRFCMAVSKASEVLGWEPSKRIAESILETVAAVTSRGAVT